MEFGFRSRLRCELKFWWDSIFSGNWVCFTEQFESEYFLWMPYTIHLLKQYSLFMQHKVSSMNVCLQVLKKLLELGVVTAGKDFLVINWEISLSRPFTFWTAELLMFPPRHPVLCMRVCIYVYISSYIEGFINATSEFWVNCVACSPQPWRGVHADQEEAGRDKSQ